jgi:predicted ATPase/class 3 adenylate cyclase
VVPELPTGTVTFLFTDVEGSTRLWEELPEAMPGALARHDAILRDAIEAHGGFVVKTTGDGFHAAFATAGEGVLAAIAAQRALDAEAWGATGRLRVRMGLHTGEASLRDGDYFGGALNRAARLMSVAHGGQVVCSQATTDLARDVATQGVDFVDLGEHRLRDLARAEHVFQLRAPGLELEFAPLASLDAFPGNLPLQVSSFIGRESEIDQAVGALSDARLVTLTGVGGVGKTRLALQVAAEVLPRFREGAWLIELAPVRDPVGVVDAVAAVFGVTPRAGHTLVEALVEFLGTKQLLLVLDNCEHVLDPVAELVEEIGRSCPGVFVLATSREGLAIAGERILALPSLSSPAPDAEFDAIAASDAVQLFMDRAHGADRTFALGSDNAASVVRVCRRLDGVPLAIELAAARVSLMSPAELASALDRRFEVLAGGRRGAVKRHQTLRATIDWSYDLLDESQQRLLVRLAVFAGGATREAVETVCSGAPIETGTVFGLLGELVARSLVVAERGGLDTRYRLLETIREYGEEHLIEHGETDGLRDRHARYYTNHAGRCRAGLFGPQQVEWGTRMTADSENILAAFAQAVDTHDLDLAIELLELAGPNIGGIGFALRLPVEPVLAMTGVEQHPGYPLVLMTAAFAADTRGEGNLAQEYGDAALDAERALTAPRPYTLDLTAYRYTLAGFIAFSTGAWDDAAAAFLEGAELNRRANRMPFVASSLSGAASALCYGGRFAEAAPVATEGLAVARATGIPTIITTNLVALAMALSRQEPERARVLLQEGSHQSLDYEAYTELTQMTLAAAMIRDWPLTARLATRSIAHAHWLNHRPFLHALLTIAARALADTDPEAAATIQGAVHTLSATLARATTTTAAGETPGAPTHAGPTDRAGLIVETRHETTRNLVDALGDETLQALRHHGATMDTDTAIAYTLSRLDVFLAYADN